MEVTEENIRRGVTALTSAYVNEASGIVIAGVFVDEANESIPWTRENYLDPSIPGSLTSEIAPTAAYMEAIWRRIHGTGSTDPLVIHQYPDKGRHLRSAELLVADSYVTFIFDQGIDVDTATGSLSNASGRGVDFNFDGTRWGHPQPRLVRSKSAANSPRVRSRPPVMAAFCGPEILAIEAEKTASF
ncbi:MAG: hypothetical protein P8R42_05475 [Candidatus Binatia bacterium]|nr:hypothetical protein [Candidatus Binatia bacterium]